MKKNYILKFSFFLLFAIYSKEGFAIDIANVNANCSSLCTTGVTSVADGTLSTTADGTGFGPISITEPFAAGADLPATRLNCTYVCEALKQKASGGLYIANTKASASSNSFTRVMCNALRVVQGSAGKSFAAFAIIAVGIGFFSGKVSWGLMIGVAAGIAAMFGAPSVVAAISGQDTDMNCGVRL